MILLSDTSLFHIATFLYVIKGCPAWLKFSEKFSKWYLVDSWKIVSKISRIGQLLTTYKKGAISRYPRNG